MRNSRTPSERRVFSSSNCRLSGFDIAPVSISKFMPLIKPSAVSSARCSAWLMICVSKRSITQFIEIMNKMISDPCIRMCSFFCTPNSRQLNFKFI
jgi:hypothetical protein